MSKWQPIETAPKDRKRVILGHPDHEAVMGVWRKAHPWEGLFNANEDFYHWALNEEDMYGFDFEPTHWMPLPEPPADAVEAAGKDQGND
ncbi:MAG: DUF551 domain-containing protein [Roseomonas sp.]|nr:DUF551 domain-containing protein [Roseomonas sp.]